MKTTQRRKTLLVVLVTAFLFVCQAGWAQQAIDKRVSVNLHSVKVTQLFNELNKQTGINLAYNADEVGKLPLITVVEKDVTVREVLDKVMPQIGCIYQAKGNVVTITKKSQKAVRKITGTIVDDSGEPLVGATVQVVGKNKFGVADQNGRFTIDDVSGDDKLQVSYLGMKTMTVPARNGQITMVSDNQIGEVVVTGLMNFDAKNFTGNASVYNGDELKVMGHENIIKSLALIDPSISLTENTEMGSDPNTMPKIRFRGESSFQGFEAIDRSGLVSDPNQPLFILDGYETSLERIVDLDTNRVESVTILKDAAAAAIYGARAANGVIVVKTKRRTA